MSNMLIEKRTEFVAKRDALIAARKAEIETKVEAYRKSLEETTPNEEVLKMSNVIAALDEVIAYESSTSTRQTQSTQVDNEFLAHSKEARPGMAEVFAPTR